MPNNILIVESGAKAKTIQDHLGPDWAVLATGGHVETLPWDRRIHGKEAGKAYWANRPDQLPDAPWTWTERGKDAVDKILDAAAGDSPIFWLAPDPDREGEFIAWSLDRHLSERGRTHRVTFQEITPEAIREAIENPGPVDQGMVDGAIVRKLLDRMVGYRSSTIARAIVGRGASMGRVQTPTLGFVVERELEREAHVPIPYFEVHARAAGVQFDVRFSEPSDDDVWRDDAGKANPSRTFDGDAAQSALRALQAAGLVEITSVKESTRTRRSSPPLTTDALLQAAGSRFGWTPKKTSALASMLYEAGHITYIRTDSTRLAASAIAAVRTAVGAAFGQDHLGKSAAGPAPRKHGGPIQDAHEAVRPTRLDVAEVDVEDTDANKLYRLVSAHTLASQMAPSVRAVVSLEARAAGLDRPLTGSVSWRTFAGWEAAFDEFTSPPATSPPDLAFEAGARWNLDTSDDPDAPNPGLVEDATKPPARYRPHTLIRAMKEAGIGRPSTYSPTVEKLEERSYVTIKDGAVAPTERGRTLWLDAAPLYAEDAADEAGGPDGAPRELFNSAFTARMEEELDRIAAGESEAPAQWERWRDQIRGLHEKARKKRDAGGGTSKQMEVLNGLLANLPAGGFDAVRIPTDLHALSYTEARELTRTLREHGVRPRTSEAQMRFMQELISNLQLTEDDLMEFTGHRYVEEITDGGQASAVLDELKQLADERRPPSAKQRAFIKDLMTQTGTAETEAVDAVGISSLDELTGGPEGSASALIDWLQTKLG